MFGFYEDQTKKTILEPLIIFSENKIFKLLLHSLIFSSDDTMISFIWFQGNLFFRFDSFLFHFLHLLCKNNFWICGRINAIRLDRNDNSTIQFKKHVSIQSHNSRLIRLILVMQLWGVNT